MTDTPMTYRKKPVAIEAIQWTGENFSAVCAFRFGEKPSGWCPAPDNTLKINTLEGVMSASIGDWIIKGVGGEFYPCKPDIFEKTYDPADMLDRKAPDGLRKELKTLLSEFAMQAWYAKGVIHPGPVADAILALIQQPSVKVKPLEWEQTAPHRWRASQTKHTYTITEYAGMDDSFMLEGIAPLKVGRPTLEAAKAAAQAHYDAAIREALEPCASDSAVSEPVSDGHLVARLDYVRRRLSRFPDFRPGRLMIKRIDKTLAATAPVPDGMVMVPRDKLSDVKDSVKTAVRHIEHMAAWIGDQKRGYLSESLGEDEWLIRDSLKNLEAMLSAAPTGET